MKVTYRQASVLVGVLLSASLPTVGPYLKGPASTNAAKSGKSAGSTKTGGEHAASTDQQIKRYATVTLLSKISRYSKRCMPTSADAKQIRTLVTLELSTNGALAGITELTQTGLDKISAAYADPIKKCIEKSIRMASPFKGLNPEYYDSWRTNRLVFKAN